MEFVHLEEQKKSKNSLRNLWDSIKKINIHIIEIPEEHEERKRGRYNSKE